MSKRSANTKKHSITADEAQPRDDDQMSESMPVAEATDKSDIDSSVETPSKTATTASDENGGEKQAEDSSSDPPMSDQEQIEALRDEVEQLNNRWLRVSADYQNFVRRSHQNLMDARQQQTMDMAKALVTVLDHFDLALEVDLESTSTLTLMDGVKIVRDELLRTLERFGVVRIEVNSGDEFDPTRHEALMRQSADGVGANQVVAQLQPGYVLDDKTLRPAQVSVSE